MGGESFAAVLTGREQPFSPPIAAQEDSMASDLDQKEEDPTSSISPAQEIAQTLKEYETIDRTTRRANASSLDQQHPLGFHQHLLSSANPSSRDTTMLTLAHSERLESFAVGVDATMHEEMQDKLMLVYGFEGPRGKMKTELRNRLGFQNLRTMNEYNASIGIGMGLKFTGYLKFLHGEFEFQPSHQRSLHLSEADVDRWQQFLSDHRDEFDFSGTLNTPEERKRFLIKNYSAQGNKLRFQNTDLKKALDRMDWGFAVKELGPVFDLLNQMKSLLSQDADYLYQCLSEDQYKLLDKIITYAFLRKTSKLGLEFAESKSIPVIFAWKVPGEDVNNLTRLHQLLEMKPYKFFPMEARINASREPSPEAITFSEMRHLGRLRQKMTVPIYVLVSKIEVVRPSQKGTLSPQKKASFGKDHDRSGNYQISGFSGALTGAVSSSSSDDGWTVVGGRK